MDKLKNYDEMANILGFKKINYLSHKQPVYQKGRKYITPDIGSGDGSGSHRGGIWKMSYFPNGFKNKRDRIGTFNAKLTRIWD